MSHIITCQVCTAKLGTSSVPVVGGYCCEPCGKRVDLINLKDILANPGEGWEMRDGIIVNRHTHATEDTECVEYRDLMTRLEREKEEPPVKVKTPGEMPK